jgi:hypothetical protein
MASGGGKDIHLHGEAELAVKVDEYGDPRNGVIILSIGAFG